MYYTSFCSMQPFFGSLSSGMRQDQWDVLCGFHENEENHETGNPLFVAASVSVEVVREAVKAMKASVCWYKHPPPKPKLPDVFNCISEKRLTASLRRGSITVANKRTARHVRDNLISCHLAFESPPCFCSTATHRMHPLCPRALESRPRRMHG